MDQRDVNNAITSFLASGDTSGWLKVLEAIRDGQVLAEMRTNTLTLTANTNPSLLAFGQSLAALRAQSGTSMKELAELLDVSDSSIIRQLRGQVLGQWPSVKLMIERMGGNPDDYKKAHSAVRTERRR